MIIDSLLDSLLGNHDEFHVMTLYLPLNVHEEAQDLAAQIGVPTSRLLAELLPPALIEARTEWRKLNHSAAKCLEPAHKPSFSLAMPPHIK